MLSESRFEKNGVSKFKEAVNDTKSTRPRIKRITNEWIATSIMFFFSLSILIAKIYINYEILDKRLYYSKQDNLSDKDISFLSDWSNLTGIPDLSESIVKQLTMTSRQFINTTNQYAKASTDAVIEVSTNYKWLIRAFLSGLIMTGFGWFIIYMDSYIPGVNPPISFRLLKRRGYRIQINSDIDPNYLISAVVGLLVFISMCLDR